MRLPKFMSGLGLIALAMAGSAQAAGDLLVAPTRVVLDGARGTEVILKKQRTARITLQGY
jgi:P pilus assembly chaperone PapD